MDSPTKDVGDDTTRTGECVVIKIGSSSLIDSELGVVRLLMLAQVVNLVQRIKKLGHDVILVSSGAVNMGCLEMGASEPPPRDHRPARQAFAAVGMSRLMRVYESLFSTVKQPIAQILLTRADMQAKQTFNNLLHSLDRLLAMNVVPIINENDTVSNMEHEFGDNDAIAAMIAGLKSAKWLFLLTDVDGLYDSNPNSNPDAQLLHVVDEIAALTVDTSTNGTAWGTGGMCTKLRAARLAQLFGSTCVISNAKLPERVLQIIQGAEKIGTRFTPREHRMAFDKRRILYCLEPNGSIVIDDNAVKAIRGEGKHDGKKSLYAAGVTAVEGDWVRGASVRLVAATSNEEVARAVCDYSSTEIDIVKGRKSSAFRKLLSTSWSDDDPEYIVHRDHIALWD